jgi:hypothetical protein
MGIDGRDGIEVGFGRRADENAHGIFLKHFQSRRE